jgi:predicted CXXCH cytochrome family protein
MFRKLAGLTAVAGLFVAGTASADITDSVHDFRATLGVTDLCAVCHTTHNDTSGVADAPLWDHAVTTQTYTPYTSNTMQSITDPTPVAPQGISALCLSCHDGTIAVDAYGGGANANFINTVAPGVGAGFLDNDLTSEHPISMLYANGDLGEPVVNFQGTPTDGVPLFSGFVECASCHDVHDQTGNSSLLINTNDNSELCLDCHIK